MIPTCRINYVYMQGSKVTLHNNSLTLAKIYFGLCFMVARPLKPIVYQSTIILKDLFPSFKTITKFNWQIFFEKSENCFAYISGYSMHSKKIWLMMGTRDSNLSDSKCMFFQRDFQIVCWNDCSSSSDFKSGVVAQRGGVHHAAQARPPAIGREAEGGQGKNASYWTRSWRRPR